MSRFIRQGQEDPMATLCRMAVETAYSDFPAAVVEVAKESILDTLAVTIGGSGMEGIPEIVDFVKARGGRPESVIPFYGGKVPASEAGLAIGPMVRAMDMGQVHEEAGHTSEYVLAALLAAIGLKERVSGKEFITAFIVGQEVLTRVGTAYKAISMGSPIGRHGGHFIFGAAAAVGKLLGLNWNELMNAETIVGTITQPHHGGLYSPPTLMVRLHHGFICQDAINACLLARRGFSGPLDVLGAPRGYMGFARWETNADALTRGLGEDWAMASNHMVKCYSACQCTHTAITGILDQMDGHGFAPEDIASIQIDTSAINWRLVCTPQDLKWNPRSVADCQFSLPYAVATAAYDRHVFLDSYTPQAMARREIRELMTRISAREDARLPPFAAKLSTTLKNGKNYSKEYRYAKGHPNNPVTRQELIDKFRKCVPYSAYQLSDEVVKSIVNSVLNLQDVDDVLNAVILPLTPA